MTREEAKQIAALYVRSRDELKNVCVPDPEDAFLVPAKYRKGNATNDAWVVHFPLVLPDEVLFREPDTLGVEVDSVTGQATTAKLL